MTDKQLFDLIGDVDPFAAYAEPTDIDTEAALRALLASGLPLDASPRSQRTNVRHPRRVALRAGVGVASVGAITFGVVNVLPSSEPGHIATASADAVIHHALAAITPSAGSVLHVDISGSQTNADGSTVSWNDESWQQDRAPYNSREIQSGPQGQASVETATVNGTEQLYDPATNTVYEQKLPTTSGMRIYWSYDQATHTAHEQKFSPQADLRTGSTPGTYELTVTPPRAVDLAGSSLQQANVQSAEKQISGPDSAATTITITGAQAQALRDGDDEIQWRSSGPVVAPVESEIGGPTAQAFHAQAVALMKSPGVQVDTQASIDGQPAIEISSENGQQVYYVTPGAYQPIELDTTGQGGGSTLRFTVYQELTGAQANAVPLSLTTEHPNATVDQSPADYQAAESRLFPNG